jgi:hypothetical protein
MKKFILWFLALLQIVLWFLLLTGSFSLTSFAGIIFDNQPSNPIWVWKKYPKIQVSQNGTSVPVSLPVNTVVIPNRHSH